MRIAYLAPELPALSATFVYNEILQLEKLGDSIFCFSVRRPYSKVEDADLDSLIKSVLFIYEQKKIQVFSDHLHLLVTKPVFYGKAIGFLINDILALKVISRNAFGVIYRFFYAANLARNLIENDCEHLHAHFANVPADLAMYASQMAGISFSITAHANDIFERAWLLPDKVRRSAFFATISEFNKKYLSDQGIAAEKVCVIRCGVNFEAFNQRIDWVSSDPVKIGVVGRLVEKKGIDTLIRAAASLKQKGINFELCIAGSGPLGSELRLLSKDLGLTSREVHFLGDMPHFKVSDFIKSLDVFALPCRCDVNGDMDGIPVALMEAMCAGVPVISTYVSGIPELVVNNETGLLVQSKDADAMADAILKMVENDSLRNRLIENAINKVKTEFSLLTNTQKLRELFHAL